MNGANGRLLTSVGLGIPLGQIVVWILETFYLEEPIPSEVAMAIGTVLGGALHAGVRLVQQIFSRRKDDDSEDHPIGV